MSTEMFILLRLACADHAVKLKACFYIFIFTLLFVFRLVNNHMLDSEIYYSQIVLYILLVHQAGYKEYLNIVVG